MTSKARIALRRCATISPFGEKTLIVCQYNSREDDQTKRVIGIVAAGASPPTLIELIIFLIKALMENAKVQMLEVWGDTDGIAKNAVFRRF